MFSIQNEIEKIIQDQDFIVLPGIGGFISEYSKPYFDTNGEIVLPQKKITFNSLIDKDIDQKLFQILHKDLRIPTEFISSEYNSFLNSFRSEIVLNKKFNWERLGLFYKSPSGEIDFYPEQLNEIPTSGNNPPIFENIEETDNIVENPLSEEIENEFEQAKKWNIQKKLLYLIPIFLLSSGLAYTIFYKPSQNKLVKKSMVEEIDSLSMAVDNLNKENTITENNEIGKKEPNIEGKEKDNSKNETQTSASSSSKKIEEPENKSGKQHIVSIGVFKNKENADNLASYLAENGFPVRVRTKNGKIKMYIVANSETQALEFVSKLEQLTGEKPVYDYN